MKPRNALPLLSLLLACRAVADDAPFNDRQPYTPYTPSTMPAPREGDWMEHSERLAKEAAAGADIAFIGDSITFAWSTRGKDAWDTRFASHWKCLNLGIAGDRTEHVLWRLRHGGNLGGGALKPKVFVVLIGTNNAGQRGDSPEAISAGVKEILDTLRKASPGSKIVLTAILPRKTENAKAGKIVLAANPLLKKLAEDRGATWFDIGDKLAPGGAVTKEIFADGLHPTTAGYEIWAKELEPVLQKLTR